MKLDLVGKTALITGGSKGIGLACARQLLEEGVRVAICSRSQSSIDEARRLLPEATAFVADLTSAEEAADVVQKAKAQLGSIDILVNSAGAAKRTPPADLTPAAWRAAMDAKYFTYINVIDPVIKLMAEHRGGVIINIIGAGGKTASPVHIPGGAANAALMLVTAGLANAYASKGVRVLGVNPGLTQTGRVAEGLKAEAKLSGVTEDEALAKAVEKIPLGRLASPEEVANVVTFLASPAASYVTGVNIGMDGAQTTVIV
ncbi:SDR family oxidoreductase (plasmid) [Agrobacterium leguminum]|uniref:Short-chain dehydrogenase/reductase SDR n=1 Tax=Agrobacterium deltaense NCPPB 1641 TaxID=1183425 RepID=A0A1S7UB80_9HYPH|nr:MULTISPECIES: SDR family oxidoreductase [Agrobacterium]WFS69749.1 SDR family oxidoreductase [Agrobacterium leguminum]CVI64059.1 conserved hypothetical protein [Agrobacterium deltaense NCPPB 1641]